MKIGFTGTQKGMTFEQKGTVISLFYEYHPHEAHHGDCIGADADFDYIAQRCEVNRVLHPPDNPSKRAFCRGAIVLPEKPYLQRNHDIVDETDMLIATPKSSREELRSGTWATVRYALKMGKKVIVVWPNGVVRMEKIERRKT